MAFNRISQNPLFLKLSWDYYSTNLGEKQLYAPCNILNKGWFMKDLFTSFKDNCGFGLLASIDNRPSHKNLEDAINALSRMMHRGAIAADGKSGDGSGLLVSMPH